MSLTYCTASGNFFRRRQFPDRSSTIRVCSKSNINVENRRPEMEYIILLRKAKTGLLQVTKMCRSVDQKPLFLSSVRERLKGPTGLYGGATRDWRIIIRDITGKVSCKLQPEAEDPAQIDERLIIIGNCAEAVDAEKYVI